MDLRGCSRMHFISVIRGGEVIKVANIARGMPELKIMNIEEIYSSIDSRCHDSFAKPPKVDRSLAMTCGFQVKSEAMSEGEEEEDEIDYDAMTLRQLHSVSKFYKRKASESGNLITVKKEVNDLLDEDEPDMRETLRSLKRKALRKTKGKKKCISISKICKRVKIEVEDAVHDLSQVQDRSLTCNDNPGHSISDIVTAVQPSSSVQEHDTTLGNVQSNILDQSSYNPFVESVPIQNSTCCLNQVSYEYLDHDKLRNPLISRHPKIEEIIKVEFSLNKVDQSLDLCGSEDRRDEDMADLLTCNVPAKTAFSERYSSNVQDHHLHHPFPLQPLSDGNSLSPIGPMSDCHDTVTEAKGISSNIKNCAVVLQDNKCMPLDHSVKSVEDNQSSILGDDSSPDVQPCTTIDQQIGSEAREGYYKDELVEQPPERLLSTRKTISPNSKERLRRAMHLAEMQDDTQNLSCKEKPFCKKNGVDTTRPSVKRTRIIFTSKRNEALCTTEIKANSRQTTKKGKYERNLSFVKGNGKGPHGSPSVHGGSECNSSLSCSQNAIAFSQQQMIDTERLATKLLTELHSMKEIVVDTLHSESRTCTISRSNTDKARVAVENVKKVEESTRRWLSIMSRDCSRFCKILEEVEKNSSSTGKSNDKNTLETCKDITNKDIEEAQQEEELTPAKNTTQRERKIMFADEAGESLCHVRVLEVNQDQHG